MQDHKKKLNIAIKALTVLLIAAVYMWVNISVDSGHILGAADEDSDEMTAVSIILSGKNAEGLENYDERLVKRTLINRGMTSDCIVLGSSRAAMIMDDYIEDGELLNLSVTGACLQDIIGIYGAYTERNGAPARVIISVDPWALNDNYLDSRFARSLGDSYYRYATEKLGRQDMDSSLTDVRPMYRTGEAGKLTDLNLKEMKELFSIPYFQSNLQYAMSEKHAASVYATKNDFDVLGVLRSDGSYGYPSAYRNSDEYSILERANSQIILADGTRIIGFTEYTSCDGANKKLLADFLSEMQRSGVEVNILFTPISPIIWEFLQENLPDCAMLQCESRIKEICDELDITYYGSFDPAFFDYTFCDFYDGYHLRAENVGILVAEMEELR